MSYTTFKQNDIVYISEIGYGTLVDCGKFKAIPVKDVLAFDRKQSLYFDPEMFNSDGDSNKSKKSEEAAKVEVVPIEPIKQKVIEPKQPSQQKSKVQEAPKINENSINIVTVKMEGTNTLVYTPDSNIRKYIIVPIKVLFLPGTGIFNIRIQINKTVQSLKKQIFDYLTLKINYYYNIKMFISSPSLAELSIPSKTVVQCKINQTSKLIITAEHAFCFEDLPGFLQQTFTLANNNMSLVSQESKPKVQIIQPVVVNKKKQSVPVALPQPVPAVISVATGIENKQPLVVEIIPEENKAGNKEQNKIQQDKKNDQNIEAQKKLNQNKQDLPNVNEGKGENLNKDNNLNQIEINNVPLIENKDMKQKQGQHQKDIKQQEQKQKQRKQKEQKQKEQKQQKQKQRKEKEEKQKQQKQKEQKQQKQKQRKEKEEKQKQQKQKEQRQQKQREQKKQQQNKINKDEKQNQQNKLNEKVLLANNDQQKIPKVPQAQKNDNLKGQNKIQNKEPIIDKDNTSEEKNQGTQLVKKQGQQIAKTKKQQQKLKENLLRFYYFRGNNIFTVGRKYWEIKLEKVPRKERQLQVGVSAGKKLYILYPLIAERNILIDDESIQGPERYKNIKGDPLFSEKKEYGISFKEGDTLGVMVYFSKDKKCSVSFYRNSTGLGVCFHDIEEVIRPIFALGNIGQISLNTRAEIPLDSYRRR